MLSSGNQIKQIKTRGHNVCCNYCEMIGLLICTIQVRRSKCGCHSRCMHIFGRKDPIKQKLHPLVVGHLSGLTPNSVDVVREHGSFKDGRHDIGGHRLSVVTRRIRLYGLR